MLDSINKENENEETNEALDEEISNNLNEISEQPNKTITFIDKIIEFITGFSSDERIKLRKLKEINKILRHSKYKFYNYKNDIILTSFAQFTYDLFRMCQNLKRYIDTKGHAQSLKLYLLELYTPTNQSVIKEQLERSKIEQLIKTNLNTNAVLEKIKNTLNSYIKSFDPETIHKIDSIYNSLVDLSSIINFDWLTLVRKFDSDISDANFSYKPEFEQIEGKYVLDELIEVSDYIETIDLNKDWKFIFEYLKAASDDAGLINVLKKVLQCCKILKKDNLLLNIIKLIYKDPFFKPKKFNSNVKVVQEYLLNFQMEIKGFVNAALKDLKVEKINNLLMIIFHKVIIIRLKNYGQKLNTMIAKKGVLEFKYIDPLNFLKAFLLDICKGEIKPRIDNILIKGTWSTNAQSSEYSQILENFNKLTDKILAFDNLCGEDENYGKNLRRLSVSIGHDQNASMILKKLVYKIDSEALQLIYDGIKLCTETINKLKLLLDDYLSKTPKIVVNFHKMDWDFPGDIQTDITEICKKLNSFIILLKNYIKNTPEATSPPAANK